MGSFDKEYIERATAAREERYKSHNLRMKKVMIEAAAPDLLEALKLMVKELPESLGWKKDETCNALEIARISIAKAEGHSL